MTSPADSPPEHPLVKFRSRFVALACIVAVVSVYAGTNLEFDRSIENMYVASEGALMHYQQLKRTFGGNEIVLAVYHDEELFSSDNRGLLRCQQIQKKLAAIPGVKAVLSIDQPLLASSLLRSQVLVERTKLLFQGYTHSADGKTVAIACMLHPENATDVPRRETIDGLRQVIQELPPPLSSGHITGEPVLVVDGFRYVEDDGRQLARWSAILLGSTIVVCFRSLRWVLIPILVVQFSLLGTNGVLRLMGMQLSMVSSMLTAVVMVIAVATMVHVIVRFSEARMLGLSTTASMSRTFRLLSTPIFWACTTDAVGFLALTTSKVGPVQDFGFMMAIGAGMVLCSVFLIVPTFGLLGSLDADPKKLWGQKELNRQLRLSIDLIEKYPRTVLYTVLFGCGLGILGMRHTQIETDFTKNFREDSEIVVAYRVVESRLGGAGVCDIVLDAPDRLSWEYLKKVRDLTSAIDSELSNLKFPGFKDALTVKPLSLADAAATLSDVDSKFEWLKEGAISLSLAGMNTLMPEFFEALYGTDPDNGKQYLRIMLRLPEQLTSPQKQKVIHSLRTICEKHFPSAKITGYFVLLSNLIDSVLQDQWRTFVLAVIGIGVVMLIAFRDWKLAMIALVPNSLPILVVTGSMGWMRLFVFPELKVNIGVAMIAAVSMGLSIDSSIHYIISFKRARKEKNFLPALQEVQQNVGRAMILSTLSLIVGFTVLATSQFVPTIYFGSMVSLAMLGGLLGNLIILPALLKLICEKQFEKTNQAPAK